MICARSAAYAFVICTAWSRPAWADPSEQSAPPVVLTSIESMDEIYTQLQTIYNDIQTAERRIESAEALLIEAMGGSTGMDLVESIDHFQSQPPDGLHVVAEGSQLRVLLSEEPSEAATSCATQLTEAIQMLQNAKGELAQIPPRLTEIQPHLVQFSKDAASTGRAAGHGTRDRLELVRKVEANQATAADLPRRTTEGVQKANLTLHRLKALTH